jgi:DNA adenine methylase
MRKLGKKGQSTVQLNLLMNEPTAESRLTLDRKIISPNATADRVQPFKTQLLKWVGNKQRFAHEIVSYFPSKFNTYYEPFLGSGAVLGTLAPKKGVASDIFRPLYEIFHALKNNPEQLKEWYAERRNQIKGDNKIAVYEKVKASYNRNPNGADLTFLCRTCYGGVVRFRQADGYMSTPCGVHEPVSAESFNNRVDIWKERVRGTEFIHGDYKEVLKKAKRGDLIYADPPYVHSQTILYGAQTFSLAELFEEIKELKSRGVYFALSIDGTKKSGNILCDLPIPDGLFETEVLINCGRSMLRRFQMKSQTLENEVVADRLLLTYS